MWFEGDRTQITLELLPGQGAMRLGVALPVVGNVCHYRKPVRLGSPLLPYPRRRIQPQYRGWLRCNRYLIHNKQRTAMAHGQTIVTLVDFKNNRLIKEWPESFRQKYRTLT